MATILIIPTPAPRTVTTALSGLLAAFSSALGRGSTAIMGGTAFTVADSMGVPDSTVAGSTADAASMVARAFTGALELTAAFAVIANTMRSMAAADSTEAAAFMAAKASMVDAGKV